jgi:parallel beta-helix repeat protein
MKKTLIGLILCSLMMLSTAVPVTATTEPKTASHPLTTGNTLYVGGLGPNNYTKIQDAINDAATGDTVFVFDESSPYFENIVIETSISLIGEDKYTTIIDGYENEKDGSDVIYIGANGVAVQGFTIQNSSLDGVIQGPKNYCGVDIESDFNTIRDNIIQDNFIGIQLGGIAVTRIYSKNNVIEGNIITNNEIYGILMTWANNNLVTRNMITFNKICGVDISWVKNKNNILTFNTISFNGKEGVVLNDADNNTIQQNTINDNLVGISVEYSNNNRVIENNIFNNEKNAQIESNTINLGRFLFSNIWDGNYWGEPKYRAVAISGACYFTFMCIVFVNFIGMDLDQGFSISFYKFDRHPAQEPYDIPSIGV